MPNNKKYKKSKAHSKQHWLDTEMALTKLRLSLPQKVLQKQRLYKNYVFIERAINAKKITLI
jgi:hypothetical protein